MSARDHYSFPVTCSQCGETGVIYYSESDYPFMKSSDLEVEKIEGRFTSRHLDQNRVEITCESCGTVVSNH